MSQFQILLFAITPLLLTAACGPSVPGDRTAVRAGMTRANVVDHLGEPAAKDTLVKQTEYIWGPPEAWWDEVAMGDSLETWSYVYPGEGRFDVYFIRGSETVSYTAFTPEGVVYEAQ